jgi:acyl dehydratase
MEAPEGARLVRRRSFTQADFDQFARLSGDVNPIHVDEEYSAAGRFGRNVAHGMFLFSVLSGVAGQLLPGARLDSTELMFPRPTFAGEEMEVEVAVTGRQGGTIDLSLEIRNRAGAPTCVGVAVVREGGT